MHSFAYPVAKLPHHIAKLTATRREIFFPRQPSPTNSSSSSSSRRSSSLLVVESRLFSNLGSNLQHEPGSVVGAATLVAGTAVGAGILALPAVCAPAGFAASAPTLIAAAGFSIITGLLVAEVCVNTMCEIGTSSGVSLGSMARRTLGEAGATAVSITYAVLHYSLLVAYISKAGETITSATGLPQPLTDVAFTALFGCLCYAAPPATLDAANAVLVLGVIFSFLGLLVITAPGVDVSILSEAHWEAIPSALPVIALAFVFQNVVPIIASSLEGDVTKIRTAIVSGVAVPLVMFLAWDAAVLGTATSGTATATTQHIITELTTTATSMSQQIDPLAALRSSGGPVASALVDGFSILAVATSFIGFVLGLSEFLAEALKLPVSGGGGKLIAYSLTLLPPLAMALVYPGLFLAALDFAGTYGVLVLFGLVPVAMVWRERYVAGTTLSSIRVVPGGQFVLVAAGLAALGVIADQLLFEK